MNWYAAKLIFESEIDGNPKADGLWEESIRIVMAASEDEARAEAFEIGKTAEHSYDNENGESVFWRFRDVEEIQDLCVSELAPGAEVFSRLFRK
jgi:hypothetical protein